MTRNHIFAVLTVLIILFGDDALSAPPKACDGADQITGQQLKVVGDIVEIRTGPGKSHDAVINQKASRILETTIYAAIGDTTTVYEECVLGEWSWIRVTDPDYLSDSHRGWIPTSSLDKGQDLGGDPYARTISSYALTPYTKAQYPKTVQQYGSRLPEIEKMRRKAAEMAVDSGKCDQVQMVELSDSKSTLDHLHFWVDCRNGERIYLDEHQIAAGSPVKTQKEKAWTKDAALQACSQAIKDRALLPSEVDIHVILGTEFYQAPTTHNMVLRMNFDAKNAFGAELPYTATCHFPPGEIGTIEISHRK
jgi:hypothetical protein